jgi:hypothetical protein
MSPVLPLSLPGGPSICKCQTKSPAQSHGFTLCHELILVLKASLLLLEEQCNVEARVLRPNN